MPCNFPVGTYRKDGSMTYRPCGSCLECRLGYAKDWALRCVHEAQMFEENSFLTLTYDNDNIPLDGSVHKQELKKFIKELRRELEPKKIRFFGCGEYGEKFSRPHYHVCLFGHDFADKEILKAKRFRKSKFGQSCDMLFISEMLGSIWKKGWHTIGEVNFQSAGYVARYITKKIGGKDEESHYKGRNKEFALMSRMPGIGAKWFERYKYDVYPKDYYVHNGSKFSPPKYYDYLLERSDPELFEQVKERRIEREKENDEARASDIVKMGKEKYRRLVTRTLERKLENASDNNVCVI